MGKWQAYTRFWWGNLSERDHLQCTWVVTAGLPSLLGFRLEEGIFSGRHHALPTPKVPFVLTFTFKGCRAMGGLWTMGMVILLERNSLYPYVGDRFFREPQVGREPPECFSFWKEYTHVVWIGLESCMCGCHFKDDAVACSDEEVISWAQGCCISNLAPGRSEVTSCTLLFPCDTRVRGVGRCRH